MPIQDSVLAAIRAELDKAKEPIRLKLLDHAVRQKHVEVTVDGELKENQEGWKAWWREGCAADVLSVLPENQQLHLRFVTGPLPKAGETILLYAPKFLEYLERIWASDWATRCEHWTASIGKGSPYFPALEVINPAWLRERQREAFKLARFPISFLWGPPGTGKTTTLAVLIANLLVQREGRILLLSATNAAVDQALVEVDEELKKLATLKTVASSLRQQCTRIGYHFKPKNYVEHQHLLPTTDETLLAELIDLESRRPLRTDPAKYADWKAENSALRRRLSKDIGDARLAAMTTTEAIMRFDELRALGLSFVAFDESSQVPKAQAIALAPLAKQAIFAGGPKQIAPICQSKNLSAREWLGKSIFDYRKDGDSGWVMLNEQSRMPQEICRIVSDVFYDGKLSVAGKSAGWKSAGFVKEFDERRFNIHLMDDCATRSAHYGGGPIRQPSAVYIADLVAQLSVTVDESDILVLTPYHSQRMLLNEKLGTAVGSRVLVSTVHAAQGTQHHTVIFDPVKGNDGLLKGEDGERIINVALSRSQAAIYMPLSPIDCENPILSEIYERATGRRSPHNWRIDQALASARQIILEPGFPFTAIGKQIRVPVTDDTLEGTVSGVTSDGLGFYLEYVNGRKTENKKFQTAYVVQAARKAAAGAS